MQIIREPDTDAALSFLQNEMAVLNDRRGHLIQIVADCEVKYQGRARSMLSRGERLLLLKPDGTFLVHTAEKAKPVNWQPPGAIFDARIQDDQLVMTAYRKKPEELVHVTFHNVSLLTALPLRDDEDLSLVGSEADLQQLLFENPDLIEPGFTPRRRERDTKRGFYDIDGDDASGTRVIVELKRGNAGVKEATQLWRYVEELRGKENQTRGILIAPHVAEKARSLLKSHDLEWKEIKWEEVLPQVEAMKHSGQTGLGRFG